MAPHDDVGKAPYRDGGETPRRAREGGPTTENLSKVAVGFSLLSSDSTCSIEKGKKSNFTMDPDRVRAYLQVACAGLGFDIGEVWWSSNAEGGSSTAVAAFEEKHDDQNALAVANGQSNRKLRFVQLYTSRSYENRRNQLVTPADEEENYITQVNGDESAEEDDHDESHVRKKHVWSPKIVDAITKTAQLVWAHTKKQEGLLGRSDMRLQTAVGMPVAVDNCGNMCVVVMFSPNNISSTDDAVEYLQSISRSATSTSIPSLLPAFDPKQGLVSLPHHHATNEMIPLLSSPYIKDGSVITRFVSLDEAPISTTGPLYMTEVHSDHSLESAPKDCFGIPMLPNFDVSDPGAITEAFDEASYGVWSTIMDNADQAIIDAGLLESNGMGSAHFDPTSSSGPLNEGPIYAINKPTMEKERLERLEEFASAFLDVSVFDFAEVWVPIGDQADHLGQVTSIISTDSKNNHALQDFEKMSEKILVRYWSGAVGRAFSSGNPVWSANQDVFVDSGRASLFSQVKIETALAVPVFSGKSNTPSFVFCCYSFVRTGSVPFVLKFVQQALRLLWDGLDKVQPHESVGENLWRDVAPADLGEMAADVEMQQHFMIKKRPRSASESAPLKSDPLDSDLALGFGSLGTPSGFQPVRSIYTGPGSSSGYDPSDDDFEPNVVPIHFQPIQNAQPLIQQAVQAMTDLKPMHHHVVSTNAQGSKRAHVFIERLDSPVEFDSADQQQQQKPTPLEPRRESGFMSAPSPLPMPRPLPLPNATLRQPAPGQMMSNSPQIQPLQIQPSYQQQPQMIVFLTPPNGSSDMHGGNMQYAPQQNHHHQQNQQQQQQGGFMGYSSTQSSHEPFDMGYSNQPQQDVNHMIYNGQQQQQPHQQHQQQQQQQQQHYQSLESTEPLSLPTDYNPLQNFNAQQNHLQQGSLPSGPANTISTNGMIFAMPTTQQGQMNHSGMGQPAANPMAMAPNGVNNDQFCITVNQGTSDIHGDGKPCRIQGCDEPAAPRRPYCARHSGNRMCEHAGCGKCAQGSTRFCIAHGGGRRCTFPGCDKGARDKFFCAAHGGGKRCKFDGCNKSAVGGSQLCTAHGGGRRCSVDGCDKSAQSSTKFCVKHGGGKKCAQDGCEKVARGRTQYCAAHGGGVRCKLLGCNRVAIGKVQLCRAHGGGTRARRSGKSGDDSHDSGGMFDGDYDDDDQDSIPGFADMASV